MTDIVERARAAYSRDGNSVVVAPTPMRHCFNCGAELGRYSCYDRLDHCGALECVRAGRDAAQQERDEAHEQLDRDMGWGRW